MCGSPPKHSAFPDGNFNIRASEGLTGGRGRPGLGREIDHKDGHAYNLGRMIYRGDCF